MLVCEGVGYELFPVDKWTGGSVMSDEEAIVWIRRLAANVEKLCFEVVGVSKDDLRGMEWLNGVGWAARNGCMIVDMQKVDDVKMVRGIIEYLGCLWLQVDMGGGGWASSDSCVVVDDG